MDDSAVVDSTPIIRFGAVAATDRSPQKTSDQRPALSAAGSRNGRTRFASLSINDFEVNETLSICQSDFLRNVTYQPNLISGETW